MKKASNKVRRLGMYLSFPHVWICFVILVLAAITLAVSYWLNAQGESYWSSIFANLFAGFVTGFIICLIGGMKQIYIVKMTEKRNWLNLLSEKILEYGSWHRKLLGLRFDKFDGDEETFNLIYDIGARANWVNGEILQSSFSKTLSFDTVEYCKKKFDYDADALCSKYEALHETLKMADIDCPSSKEIFQSFESVDHLLCRLNLDVRKAIDDLDVRLSVLQKSII